MASHVAKHDYDFLADLLRARLGHDLGPGKEYLITGRLGPLASARGLPDITALVDHLRRTADPRLREAVLDALVTGETSFFRTARLFESLRATVIPSLVAARAQLRRLRIWSAACSTGQEPFSVAILLQDAFPELRDWSVEILATDSSEQAVHKARDGVFTAAEVKRGLREPALLKHFRPAGKGWKIEESTRHYVKFRQFNLLDDLAALHRLFDVVLLCNVSIYFDLATKSDLLRRVRGVMRDDGYLFLGESETILGITTEFQLSPGGLPFYRPAGHSLGR